MSALALPHGLHPYVEPAVYFVRELACASNSGLQLFARSGVAVIAVALAGCSPKLWPLADGARGSSQTRPAPREPIDWSDLEEREGNRQTSWRYGDQKL